MALRDLFPVAWRDYLRSSPTGAAENQENVMTTPNPTPEPEPDPIPPPDPGPTDPDPEPSPPAVVKD